MADRRLIADANGRQSFADSFDRFGDDMTELIVSYLSFEDKLSLHCLSKQWKRLVLNKQTALRMTCDDFGANEDRVRQLFKYKTKRKFLRRLYRLLAMCPNIASIVITDTFYLKDKVLDIITDLCPRLESLTFTTICISSHAISRFGQRLGQTLKSIHFTEYRSEDISKEILLLSLCPNLESLRCDHNFAHLISSAIISPMKKLKNLSISDSSDIKPNNDIIGQLSRLMPSLVSFSTDEGECLSLTAIPEPMPTVEQLIAKNVKINDQFVSNLLKFPNLKRLSLFITGGTISDHLLLSLSTLRSLTALNLVELDSYDNSLTDSGVCHLIDSCKHLEKIEFLLEKNVSKKIVGLVIERAHNNPKSLFRFTGYGSQSLETIENIPKNLMIEIKGFIPSSSDKSD